MRKLALCTVALTGLLGALSVSASAAPLAPLMLPQHANAAPAVQHVYYYWNHHRYYHRRWDRHSRRWRYY